MAVMVPAIDHYLVQSCAVGDPILDEMGAEGRRRSFPIIGPVVGQILRQQLLSIGARKVFEMGSGFGYSTAWSARAVGEGGSVVHTDGSKELSNEARTWLTRMGVVDRVRFEVGDARDVLAATDDIYDAIFIDIDKDGYPDAWALACDKVRVGGIIFTDNVLWSGKVADEAVNDDWTKAIRRYLRLAHGDARFLTTILPVRDGVAISLRLN